MQKANEKLAVVKAAKDDTLDWDSEFAKSIKWCCGTSSKSRRIILMIISWLLKTSSCKKEDTTALFNLAMALSRSF